MPFAGSFNVQGSFGAISADNFDSGAALDGQVLTADGAGGTAFEDAAGGGAAITDLTYADLVAAIGASTLMPSAQYRITDFATTHYIVDAGGTTYETGDGIIVGPNEPLIVIAVAANKLHAEAKSALYPQDVIHYDWDPANWLADLSFGGSVGTTIITGFKGVITWRHDTLLDNYAPGDWRHCKSRRWKTAVPDWNSGTAYNAGNYVTYTAAIFRALQAHTNHPPTEMAYWVEIISLVDIEYWNGAPASFNGIASSAEYADFVLYAPGLNSAVYERCVRATHWGSFKDDQANWDVSGTFLNNNVVFLADAEYYTCYLNSIRGESFYNTIGAYFSGNEIGQYFQYNTVSTGFGGNAIGAHFRRNIGIKDFVGNSIGSGFINNSIGSGFINNSIGSGFDGNSIGSGFDGNSIGSGFVSNRLKYGFTMNRVADGAISATNFTTATHVYAYYNCDIFRRVGSGSRLSYYNASDVLTVVAATA